MRKCLDELSQYHDFYHDDKKELTFEFHFKGKLTLFRHETLWKAFDSFFPQGQSQGFHFNGLLIRLALKTEIAYFWLWKKILRTLFTSDGNTSLGNLICKSQVILFRIASKFNSKSFGTRDSRITFFIL